DPSHTAAIVAAADLVVSSIFSCDEISIDIDSLGSTFDDEDCAPNSDVESTIEDSSLHSLTILDIFVTPPISSDI
ncbi:hypothetical protein KI387_004130, partial [Taxus chinensis]